ncbi:ectonucleotide pyrophosphatase/phosphodiesterase [Mucilaginibacter sp. RS28]|uniref:Ectonucleotide pyrophosphatase/phosphodiesterase n=1 Tax=Mucilaginibacter straminoryzae TaxID=2932774 RepID=A0A9X1X6C8_9SPHI|nr:ectonucleotide pyrophosphatase/phosphodiesterase [Mucilaginibacter straminoryzae]MCJ8210955.1 ectonucleotide pyrophosphatase/phosphodiesterase [Mucilaginibacter straminoryzae]
MMKLLTFVILSFLAVSTVSAQSPDTVQRVDMQRQNTKAQQQKPYVILISIDGFRYDYMQRHHAEHLQQLSKSGVRATEMIPSFPSLTFPNHYTLVTGLYPAHHGLVQNQFWDRNFKERYYYKGKTTTEGKWYGGTPLWVLAEKQHMLSSSFYWVGSEAPIQGVYPTYYYKYNESIPIHERIGAVVNWLKQPAERRPHLITFYFPEVDHEGHHHGPDSKENVAAIHFVDSAINELNKAVEKTGLKVNFVVVSDHGMGYDDTVNALPTPAVATDTTKFIRADEGVLIHLYAKDQSDVKPAYDQIKAEAKGYEVYLRDSVPAYLHYGAKDDWHNHIGDIILIPEWPRTFNTNHRKIDPGAHGFDPYKVRDMHATFLAWGPNFKKNLVIPAFQNIDIYPMIVRLLGLKLEDKIDGTDELARKVLLKKNN